MNNSELENFYQAGTMSVIQANLMERVDGDAVYKDELQQVFPRTIFILCKLLLDGAKITSFYQDKTDCDIFHFSVEKEKENGFITKFRHSICLREEQRDHDVSINLLHFLVKARINFHTM